MNRRSTTLYLKPPKQDWPKDLYVDLLDTPEWKEPEWKPAKRWKARHVIVPAIVLAVIAAMIFGVAM